MAQAGQVLDGRYRLVEPLGRGGMGEVWRGHDGRLDRHVAVKVLADLGDSDQKYAKLFQSEAKAAARLAHPGITMVHDFGSDQGMLFLVMELLRGESLAEVMRRHPGGAEVGEVCGWGAQVAEALAQAHAARVVHRDIKPGNLMLTPTGQVKVCDFGIARLQDATGSFTAAGMGTAAYMAPEQITDGPVDGRTDVYALGCTLYHLLSGRAPFEATNPWAVARKHLDEAPDSVRSLRADIPEALDELLLRMLAKDPADRPQDAGEVAAELAQAVGTGGTRPESGAAPETAAEPEELPTVSSPTPVVAALAGPSPRERLAMLITGCLLIVGLWTPVAIGIVDEGDFPRGLSYGAIGAGPFIIVGAYVPLLFLHRNPWAGRKRRIAGLWAAGTSAMAAFLLSLLWVLEGSMRPRSREVGAVFDIAFPLLAVLCFVGPAFALVEVGLFGPSRGTQARRPPLWRRVVVGLVLLMSAAWAVIFIVVWFT